MNGTTATSTVVEVEGGEEGMDIARQRTQGLVVNPKDLRYDDFLFPIIPEPPDTLRDMTSREAEIRSIITVQVSHTTQIKS